MDSTGVFGTSSLSSNLSRTASSFSATFSATYFYYEKSELYLKKKDTKQNFGTWIWGSSPYETAK